MTSSTLPAIPQPRRSNKRAWLIIPYLALVTFATALNFKIGLLN